VNPIREKLRQRGAAAEDGPGLRRLPLAATEKGEDAQRHLLAAAMRSFGARGYAGTSMRDIAAEAGQNVASLYYYFPSKSVLVASLVEHCAQTTVRDLRGATSVLAIDGKERARPVLASLLALARRPSLETRVLTDLAAQVSHDAALRDAVRQAFDEIGQEIARRLGTPNGDPAVAVLVRIVLGLVVLDGVSELPGHGTDESGARVLEAMTRSLLGAT
jgi:AcrR family transcriptional regulator